jgi:putative ABC transport system permease protein
VLVIIGFASWTTRRRAPEVPSGWWLPSVAYAAATAVTLGVLFGFRVFPLTPQTLVPLAGMIVGNSLTATVLVGRRIIAEVRDKRDEIEARLALAQPARVAARPYLRAAVRDALVPQIEATKAVGIVFLPGAMVGLLLAGVDPLDAVKVQAAVMYLVLGSVATTTAVVAIGLSRRLFTSDHRLVHLPRR